MQTTDRIVSVVAGEPIKVGDAVALHEGKVYVIPRHIWGDSER